MVNNKFLFEFNGKFLFKFINFMLLEEFSFEFKYFYI